MSLNKVNYVDGVTVITAQNMNDIQEAIISLEETPQQGLTDAMKQALLQLAQKVAYIDDKGQTYYDDLYNALYPPKTVVSITAVFEQGSTVIYDDTALNDLKQYLTVTAKYDDNTTAILPDASYTLSGLLEAGTSTVTVTYNSVTTTFTVSVTARPTLSSITATYTQSGTVYDTDTLDSLKADLVVTAVYSDSSTQTLAADAYTLSGTLAEGTSTITVSYGGKTASFDVTVSLSLDSIAYGTLTYRDIFITNNAIPLGDFETTLSLTSSWVNWQGNSKKRYKASNGTPIQTTEQSNSPTHSLKCTGSPVPQINYIDETLHPTGNWLACISGNVSAVGETNAGTIVGVGIRGIYPQSGQNLGTLSVDEVTIGFAEKVKIFDFGSNTTNVLSVYIGSAGQKSFASGYVDDVILTPLPDGLTEQTALTLYQKYCAIRRAG